MNGRSVGPTCRHRHDRRSSLLGAVLIAATALTACNGSSEQGSAATGAPQPPEAGYLVVHPQPVVLSTNVAGRVVAFKLAEIRPQVGGIIQERVFTEGTEVKRGDVLYRLDSESYEAAVASAEATLKKNEAALPSAKSKLDRYRTLSTTSAVSQQDRDDAESSYLQAQAAIAVAQADLQTAKINLGYATITAPIDGRIGTSSVSTGSLVTASQSDPLATIRQLDPVYVDLTESSANLIKFRNQLRMGGFRPIVGGPETKAEVHLSFADGTPYDLVGEIKSADQFVAQTTSTFTIRSRFDNPERRLLPGMYVLGTISLARDNNGILLPQRSVSRNANGEATARFIKTDDTVETRVLEVAIDIGPNWLVTKGVSDGDRLIVDGLQNAQDGKPVKPVEVKLDANGVEVTVARVSSDNGKQAASIGK
ncbi:MULTISPECIES: efflux RND transporter periplasmic adaptor subunit [unclassified Sinorhizobium]|uniref:efflux RND transporter periplasmic adaptor subunit n=1 Tax=unclassified Sinorhizobium TaxID=2613772 RepID=UPI0035245DD0